MKLNVLLPIALAGAVLTAACDRSARSGSDDPAAKIGSGPGSYTYERREEFRAEMERGIDKLEARLAELRQKAATEGSELKGNAKEMGDDIERELAEARRKLSGIGSATRENWNEFTRKFSDSMSDLGRRIDRAFGG